MRYIYRVKSDQFDKRNKFRNFFLQTLREDILFISFNNRTIIINAKLYN